MFEEGNMSVCLSFVFSWEMRLTVYITRTEEVSTYTCKSYQGIDHHSVTEKSCGILSVVVFCWMFDQPG